MAYEIFKTIKGLKMKQIVFLVLTAMMISACSSKSRGIDLVSPCACYEMEKITSNKG